MFQLSIFKLLHEHSNLYWHDTSGKKTQHRTELEQAYQSLGYKNEGRCINETMTYTNPNQSPA